MKLKFIDLRIFFFSLFLGLLFVYIIKSDNEKIHVLPTPENINELQFKDTVGNCFEFEKTEVNCDNNTENYIIQ